MNCPACGEVLVVVEREGIELDWCVECRGVWFDEGELELLAEKSGRRLEAEDVGRAEAGEVAPQPRDCPRCRKRMVQVRAGREDRVRVDRCNDHGLWLDRGELGRILRQLETTGKTDESVIIRFLGEALRAGSQGDGSGSAS